MNKHYKAIAALLGGVTSILIAFFGSSHWAVAIVNILTAITVYLVPGSQEVSANAKSSGTTTTEGSPKASLR